MTDLKNTIPNTLHEAINTLYNDLKQDEIDFIKSNDNSLIHHGTGMTIRNNWKLWEKDTPFKHDIKEKYNLFGHGDDCSGLIFTGLWAKVKGHNVDSALKKEAKRYTTHWKNSGIDPVTGEEIPGFKNKNSFSFKLDKNGKIEYL